MAAERVIRRSRTVSGQVGAYLEELIRTELAPGERLPTERVLAERLDVSRTSVREAMRSLEERRLIARSPGRGTTVLPPPDSAQDLGRLSETEAEHAHVAELRSVVEPRIAALAAQRATEADLLLLEQTLAASHAGLTPAESLELDERFHLQLATASGNPLLASLCGLTNGWVHDVRAHSHRTRTGRRTSDLGHRAIYEAVLVGDAAAAEAAMAAHLTDVAALVGASR